MSWAVLDVPLAAASSPGRACKWSSSPKRTVGGSCGKAPRAGGGSGTQPALTARLARCRTSSRPLAAGTAAAGRSPPPGAPRAHPLLPGRRRCSRPPVNERWSSVTLAQFCETIFHIRYFKTIFKPQTSILSQCRNKHLNKNTTTFFFNSTVTCSHSPSPTTQVPLTATTLSTRSWGILGSSGAGWYFSSKARNWRELSLKHVDDIVAMSSGADWNEEVLKERLSKISEEQKNHILALEPITIFSLKKLRIYNTDIRWGKKQYNKWKLVSTNPLTFCACSNIAACESLARWQSAASSRPCFSAHSSMRASRRLSRMPHTL